MLDYFGNCALLKPALGAWSVLHISSLEQTQLNLGCQFLFFGECVAPKRAYLFPLHLVLCRVTAKKVSSYIIFVVQIIISCPLGSLNGFWIILIMVLCLSRR